MTYLDILCARVKRGEMQPLKAYLWLRNNGMNYRYAMRVFDDV